MLFPWITSLFCEVGKQQLFQMLTSLSQRGRWGPASTPPHEWEKLERERVARLTLAASVVSQGVKGNRGRKLREKAAVLCLTEWVLKRKKKKKRRFLSVWERSATSSSLSHFSLRILMEIRKYPSDWAGAECATGYLGHCEQEVYSS